MSYHRQGKIAEGRPWLDKAGRWKPPEPPDSWADEIGLTAAWTRRLTFKLLRDEAETLYKKGMP